MKSKTIYQLHSFFFTLLLIFSILACSRDLSVSCAGDPPEIIRPSHWHRNSHCRDTEPNYKEVFDDTVLHRFDISITPSDYASMMSDMEDKFGGGTTLVDLDALPSPIWVPATVNYRGKTWTKVGIRWKGHSSLKAVWQNGIRKLSFLLSFDYFEDAYPEIDNQRFYGFKKLSFSNAYNDPAVIREKLAYEIFRAAGVPVPHAAFAPVYLNWGEGAQYLGMYTMIENPADKMLVDQFGDDSGNLYKPWGNAARWLNPSESYGWQDNDWDEDDWLTDIEGHFEKCTNEEEADWTDIVSAIKRLHRDRNVPEQWRANLEEVFDVHSFLKTLAVNQIIVNWDSYGCMHHNYYIYANPRDNRRFVWFPWDLNEAMLPREQLGCISPGSVMLEEIVYPTEEQSEIDSEWPLIQLLLSDGIYRNVYRAELRSILDGPFAVNKVKNLMDRYHALIAPYIIGPQEIEIYPYSNTTKEGFENSLTSGQHSLGPHIQSRHTDTRTALGL